MRYALAIFLALLAAPVSAQVYDIPGSQNSVLIRATPAYPTPNSTVRLSVASPLLDLSQSYIAWRINGEPLTEGEGATAISVQVAGPGETTEISASVILGEDTALATLDITPASVDILWEADGYTPPFYKGRTLPGVGAPLTFVAYPTFLKNSARIAEKDLVYTWRRGETVLGSQSGKGRTALSIQDPLMGAEVISVEVRSSDGAMVAQSSVQLPEPSTITRLYHDHPLFGLMLHNAIAANAFTGETEATFQAIPFFAPTQNIHDGSLIFDWHVNQRSVPPDASKPSEITINAQGSDGIALITLDINHSNNFFFGTNAAWQITFASSDTGPGVNPFAPQQ